MNRLMVVKAGTILSMGMKRKAPRVRWWFDTPTAPTETKTKPEGPPQEQTLTGTINRSGAAPAITVVGEKKQENGRDVQEIRLKSFAPGVIFLTPCRQVIAKRR
jgi:hypothetical protein